MSNSVGSRARLGNALRHDSFGFSCFHQMKILFVDSQYPMFDRASADVRMFAIVQLLRVQGHDCDYFASDIGQAEQRLGAAEVGRYREALRALGMRTLDRIGFEQVLSANPYDAFYFKYFYPAEARIPLVRIWQPRAKVVVDSVDLVYARLLAKSEVSGLAGDRKEAEQTKLRELATYAAADLVITVTEDEAKRLEEDLPGIPVHVIPNIHELPSGPRSESPYPSLLFIGTFSHEPNVDGVLWFAREVWPVVLASNPDARLRIVGGNPPASVAALAGKGIEILGYVPDTLPYLMESWVSVAPLRFGAGMKGKVGEAMAAGLPVVATRFGAEGFGLTPGEHLLVADEPAAFGAAIDTLLRDHMARARLGQAGRDFIEMRYSPAAVQRQLAELVGRLEQLSPLSVRFARLRLLVHKAEQWMQRNLLWRLQSDKS